MAVNLNRLEGLVEELCKDFVYAPLERDLRYLVDEADILLDVVIHLPKCPPRTLMAKTGDLMRHVLLARAKEQESKQRILREIMKDLSEEKTEKETKKQALVRRLDEMLCDLDYYFAFTPQGQAWLVVRAEAEVEAAESLLQAGEENWQEKEHIARLKRELSKIKENLKKKPRQDFIDEVQAAETAPQESENDPSR